jgi:hypothetical protein
MSLFKACILGIIAGIPAGIFAQEPTDINNTITPNSIKTAVPFMTISPDSRSSAMGDVGVATSPDVNSQHWNPAKYVFLERKSGLSLSYSPWLRSLVDDMNLLYLTGYMNIDRFQAVSASLRYFDMGSIQFTDVNGSMMTTGNPNEFAFDLAYSRKFSDRMSVALAFRYIRSDISGGVSQTAGTKAKAGNSFAADIAMYYHSEMTLGGRKGTWAAGADISNIGTKMTYSRDQGKKMFLPINLSVGGSAGVFFDEYNKLTLAVDFNKLLVPTPPERSLDGTILRGKEDEVGIVQGIFQSFYDAPGGFAEELHEITCGVGLEYLYKNIFAVRTGYHHENRLKGNRRYFSMGVGVVMNIFEIDFSYLVPTQYRDPLANTLRFSLIFNLGQTIKTNL